MGPPYVAAYVLLVLMLVMRLAQAMAEGAAPAEGAEEKKEEEKKEPENLGDREELWAHKWSFDELETIKAEAFYRCFTC